jgi:hypothetical protein
MYGLFPWRSDQSYEYRSDRGSGCGVALTDDWVGKDTRERATAISPMALGVWHQGTAESR